MLVDIYVYPYGTTCKNKKSFLPVLPVLLFRVEDTRQRDWDGIITCHYGTSEAQTWNFQNKCIGKHSLKPKHEVKDSVVQVFDT